MYTEGEMHDENHEKRTKRRTFTYLSSGRKFTEIRYENESKSYIIDKGAFQMPYGEDTTVQAQLDDWIAHEDGTFQFILNDNGYKDELPDPLFYYTISNVSLMDDSFSDLTQETEENSPGQEPSTQNVSE